MICPATATARSLPKGWQWVKLGEVCEIVNGTTPKSGESRYWNGEVAWITPTDLGKLPDRFINSSDRRISKAGFESCNLTMAPVGSVVLSSRAPIGHLGIAAVPLCTNQGCKTFIPGAEVDSEFLYHALKRSVWHLQRIGSGATFAEVSKTQLESFEILLPPLPEQKRLAAILNEQMAATERARNAAEDRLAAVNALPAAYLRAVFPASDQPLPGGWRWVKLGEVLHLRSGDFLPATSMDSQGDFPVYGGNGVTGFHSSYMFEEPKVIVGRVGVLCGCVHLTKPRSWITDNALYVDVKKYPLDDEFLFFLLTNMDLRSLANQMGQPVISGASIYATVCALPPLPEQRRIAALLTEQMAKVDRARKAAEEELQTINAMPSALLRRAFAGEI